MHITIAAAIAVVTLGVLIKPTHLEFVNDAEREFKSYRTERTKEEISQITRQPEHVDFSSMARVCNSFDTTAPCRCKEILTNHKVTLDQGRRRHVIEFPEYLCETKVTRLFIFDFLSSGFIMKPVFLLKIPVRSFFFLRIRII